MSPSQMLLDLLAVKDHVGVSELRVFNKTRLRAMGCVTAIHHGAKPVSVLIPYESFMAAQRLYQEAEQRINKLQSR